MPNTKSIIQTNNLFLQTNKSQLHLTYTNPNNTNLPLLITKIIIQHLNMQTPLYITNTIYTQHNNHPDWQIVTFNPNTLNPTTPKLSHNLNNQKTKLQIADTTHLLKTTKKPTTKPHIPPIIIQTKQLTTKTLLKLFIKNTKTIFPNS